MAECGCGSGGSATSASGGCCGGAAAADDYRYGEQPFETGRTEATLVGEVPVVATALTLSDTLGAWRMRWNLGRGRYRVRPGLYAAGRPDDRSPVLVTANYKLTFDVLRSRLAGRDAWLLVLDTRGINVWCAAGKGTFGTKELIRRVNEARLSQVVSHATLVVPQLGATGVAGHLVREATGFRVKWGPVSADDLPTFLDAGMRAEPEMRRVRFGLRDRAVLIPVELSFVWQPKALLGIAAVIVAAVAWSVLAGASLAGVPGALALGVAGGFVGGTVLVPIALPWLPGRAFALKGALVGAAIGVAVAAAWLGPLGTARAAALVATSSAIASFTAMNFTGSSTYTSPSGVEWEMRRALPWQIAGAASWLVALAAGVVVR